MPYGQSLGRHLPHQSIRYGFNAPNLAFLLFSADAFLHFHESRQTLLLQRLWHMITQRIRCSAIHCRISKTPYPIQLGFLQKLKQVFKILIRFAGEAGDIKYCGW